MVQGFKIRDRNIFLNIQSKVETLRLIFDRSIGKTAIKINIAHHFGTKMNTPSKKKKRARNLFDDNDLTRFASFAYFFVTFL